MLQFLGPWDASPTDIGAGKSLVRNGTLYRNPQCPNAVAPRTAARHPAPQNDALGTKRATKLGSPPRGLSSGTFRPLTMAHLRGSYMEARGQETRHPEVASQCDSSSRSGMSTGRRLLASSAGDLGMGMRTRRAGGGVPWLTRRWPGTGLFDSEDGGIMSLGSRGRTRTSPECEPPPMVLSRWGHRGP